MPGVVVTAKKDLKARLRQIVDRCKSPLRRLRARHKQALFVGKTIAITGSVGKTSATRLLTHILSADHRVRSTGGKNKGSHMLRLVASLSKPTDYVVQELSAFSTDAFDQALTTLKIDVAVVTRIGLDHASLFRTEDGVAEVQGRLVESVARGGFACLNADDPRCRAMTSRTTERVILYGEAADAEVRAQNISAHWPSRMSFDLIAGGRRHKVKTRMVGTLLLPSVLASLAVVHGLGLDLEAAIGRLAKIEPPVRRMSVLENVGQHTFIRDTDKAPYWSTLDLVDDLKNWGPVRRIFVLGEMSDIRNDSSRRYRQVMRTLAENADLVIGVSRAESAARKLPDLPNVIAAATVQEVATILRDQPPSLVILKSNKTYRLELIFEKMAPHAGIDAMKS
jgi:UDP-N-acetylmuramoyl-tripeptide--D-alanyl-D-alanine ligase